jgi:hypothetical protein
MIVRCKHLPRRVHPDWSRVSATPLQSVFVFCMFLDSEHTQTHTHAHNLNTLMGKHGHHVLTCNTTMGKWPFETLCTWQKVACQPASTLVALLCCRHSNPVNWGVTAVSLPPSTLDWSQQLLLQLYCTKRTQLVSLMHDLA